jgi:hypothetical protein
VISLLPFGRKGQKHTGVYVSLYDSFSIAAITKRLYCLSFIFQAYAHSTKKEIERASKALGLNGDVSLNYDCFPSPYSTSPPLPPSPDLGIAQ